MISTVLPSSSAELNGHDQVETFESKNNELLIANAQLVVQLDELRGRQVLSVESQAQQTDCSTIAILNITIR